MIKWQITGDVFPHSTGKGAVADRAAAGDRHMKVIVEAAGIRDALKMADAVVAGIKHNPAVWEVHITGINKQREGT